MRLQDVIQRDTRANQPAATDVAVGTLFGVTDEDDIIERSNGTTWDSYSPTGGGGDVVGPVGATDEALARFDGATGLLLQNSLITLSNTGALTFPDDVRQTFNPGANASGFNAGSLAGDPATPSDGDVWYNSSLNALRARINGATVSLGAGGGSSDWTTTVIKTVNDDVTNSSTLTSDSELIIGLTSGKRYLCQAVICLRVNDASVNYKWTVLHPGSSSQYNVFGFYDYITNGGSPTLVTVQGTTGFWPTAAGVAYGGLVLNDDMWMICNFMISPNATGNMIWQQANANAAPGRTSSTRIGSMLRVKLLN